MADLKGKSSIGLQEFRRALDESPNMKGRPVRHPGPGADRAGPPAEGQQALRTRCKGGSRRCNRTVRDRAAKSSLDKSRPPRNAAQHFLEQGSRACGEISVATTRAREFEGECYRDHPRARANIKNPMSFCPITEILITSSTSCSVSGRGISARASLRNDRPKNSTVPRRCWRVFLFRDLESGGETAARSASDSGRSNSRYRSRRFLPKHVRQQMLGVEPGISTP